MARSARLEAELARGVKTCTRCKEVRPLADYAPNGTNKKTGTQYRDGACRDCMKVVCRKWHADNRNGKAREIVLNRKYGITVEDYEAMLVVQSQTCAICRQPEPGIDPRTGVSRRLAVDHCHVTGKVHGLLCTLCNQAIGQFKHDPDLLRAALDYLQVTDRVSTRDHTACKGIKR